MNMKYYTNMVRIPTDFYKFHQISKVHECMWFFNMFIIIIVIIGDYNQYDTIIYPESAKPGMGTRFYNLVTGNDQGKEIVIPQHHEMSRMCLMHFLEPSKQLLINGTFDQSYDITAATNDLLHIYNSCYNQKVVKGHWPKSDNVDSLKEVEIFNLFYCDDNDLYYYR